MLKTWAKETKNLEFYSEVEDKTIPTVDLGIPNTERGNLYSYIVYSFFFLISQPKHMFNMSQ